ncbi:MAG: permease-like cell division protein FtsX [Steroidobacterales bacterium]
MNISAYFARHAQTFIGSLGRIAAHPVEALMTMAVIGFGIALPLCLYVFLQNAHELSSGWANAYDLSVYLDKGASLARAQAVARELQARGDIAAVRVIPAAQALAEFRDYSGFGAALDALAENPLPNSLIVTPAIAASTHDGTVRLKNAITAIADVSTVQIDTDWVKRLNGILDVLRRVVLLAGALLGVAVMLIVGNTIRLDILNRRAEIEVMKLVGASDRFARRPFLYSGVWYGLGGALLALGLVTVAVWILENPVARLAALYGSQFTLKGLDAPTSLAVLGAAIVLGWVGSWIAASQHIRAINPS